LEQVVIDALLPFEIKGERTENTGIWIGNSKIAALGIHIQKYVTSHGFALNCNTDLTWFDHIEPCGLAGLGVTSVSKELGRMVTVENVLPSIVKAFESNFNCDII
jgi:lipoyl(octanoyl) transferase